MIPLILQNKLKELETIIKSPNYFSKVEDLVLDQIAITEEDDPFKIEIYTNIITKKYIYEKVNLKTTKTYTGTETLSRFNIELQTHAKIAYPFNDMSDRQYTEYIENRKQTDFSIPEPFIINISIKFKEQVRIILDINISEEITLNNIIDKIIKRMQILLINNSRILISSHKKKDNFNINNIFIRKDSTKYQYEITSSYLDILSFFKEKNYVFVKCLFEDNNTYFSYATNILQEFVNQNPTLRLHKTDVDGVYMLKLLTKAKKPIKSKVNHKYTINTISYLIFDILYSLHHLILFNPNIYNDKTGKYLSFKFQPGSAVLLRNQFETYIKEINYLRLCLRKKNRKNFHIRHFSRLLNHKSVFFKQLKYIYENDIIVKPSDKEFYKFLKEYYECRFLKKI